MTNQEKYMARKEIIGERIKKERERLGLSKKKLLTEIYMSEASHKTLTAWEEGERIPDLDTLTRMADLFECDMGYLLGDYDEHRRVTADVCAETGLSEDAVYFLRELKENPTYYNSLVLPAINTVLAESKFEDCVEYWRNLELYLSSSEKPFKALMDYGEHTFSAEQVLSMALSENHAFLKKWREERKNG